ncbi:metal/formaldehyde-sensitive transcriptional repressor [Allorhizobium sp. BGMRC 0089]|uniref:metal/formaldehyde-sensitive transcriptional repressor n=1 Tax=Allorhizobium sonneratiae TaxID=2934936 RepID=UPI0020342EA0|nr:metal/formaldehyde-sensitive transcriptional repressor [Allorhizobium sonneratiae]MCM2294555.1 metal/formaldehyde-sensitive transcriptional repressor [Allorhizobium sonneratiae]
MSHVIHNKDKLLARVRRMKGQMEAIENALIAEKSCGEVLNLAASVRGALSGLTAELIEHHVEGHILAADLDEKARQTGADELLDVIRSYLK